MQYHLETLFEALFYFALLVVLIPLFGSRRR